MKVTNQLKTRSKDIDPYRLKVQVDAAPRTLAAHTARSDSFGDATLSRQSDPRPRHYGELRGMYR